MIVVGADHGANKNLVAIKKPVQWLLDGTKPNERSQGKIIMMIMRPPFTFS